MKFGNLLRCSAETNPQLLELFKAYKQAKKKIKMVVPPGAPDQGVASTSQAEASFVDILSADVQQCALPAARVQRLRPSAPEALSGPDLARRQA